MSPGPDVAPRTGRLSRVPLRTQLVALLLGTVALVVALTSVAGSVALHDYLVNRIDVQLAAALEDPGGPGGAGFGRPRRGGGPDEGGRDVAVTTLDYDAEGRLSPRDVAELAAFGGPEVDDPTALPDGPSDVPAVSGAGSWRVLAGDGSRTGGVRVVAVSLDGVRDTGSQLLLINAAVGLIALAGAGVLAWAAVRRSLAPLVSVEETAEAIAAGDLTRRVREGDPRTEVGSLAASFNSMVDRFESAYSAQQQSESAARASEERMRRFVGDASHELRTPLTSIRGFAELFRQGAAREPEQLARVMRRIEDEAARMGLLVEDLLLLARLDQQRPLRQETVDLLSVVADVVHDAATVYEDHTVRLVAPTGPGLPEVVGDDPRLRQVFSNLVTNAVTHTARGTTVDVALHADHVTVTVTVTDDGAGMAPDVAERVFERFYRADASRSRTAPQASGSGLGLSIVAALVAAHGGSVEVTSTVDVGTCFLVRLPARPVQD